MGENDSRLPGPGADRCLTLVPNSRRQNQHFADALRPLSEGGVIVRPPVRVLSQWLEETHAAISLLEGTPAMSVVDAFDLSEWWAEAIGREYSLWSRAECRLAARQARAADRLIDQWWAGDEAPWMDGGFYRARQQVSGKLESEGLATQESLVRALIRRLEAPEPLPLALPERLELDGFHELTRLEANVLDSLHSRGVEIVGLDQSLSSAVVPSSRVICFPAGEHEWSAMADWAAGRIEAGDQHIALVVNRLDRHLDPVRDALDRALGETAWLQLEVPEDDLYHMPVTGTLADHPAIRDALLLLELSLPDGGRKTECGLWSKALLSPYCHGAQVEYGDRATFERYLRSRGCHRVSRHQVVDWIMAGQEARKGGAGQGRWRLQQFVDALSGACTASRVDRLPGDRLVMVLRAWGWPGPLAKGRNVQVIVDRFRGLLEKLNAGAWDAAEAADRLVRMCQEATVSERGGPLSPVQVMSPEDAAGRKFDAAWIANVHDGNWPSTPGPNPYLSAEARRSVPRLNPDGELEWCKRLNRALGRIADTVIQSWSVQGEFATRGLSPLLDGRKVEEADIDGLRQPCGYRSVDFGAVNGYRDHPWLTATIDGDGKPLGDAEGQPEGRSIPGGAAAFAEQSACPLGAYLRRRLGARFDPLPPAFADAAFRGMLMHSALEYLYGAPETGDSEGLVDESGSSPGPAPGDIGRAVERALARHDARTRLLRLNVEAERQRLVSLLEEWLEFESGRRDFLVEQREREVAATVHGHPVSMRVDRIDRLADGSLMIIDYKSGKPAVGGWAKERIAQPQLPVYATLLRRVHGDTVSAVAVASVRSGDCAMQGIAAAPDLAWGSMQAFGARKGTFSSRFDDWGALLAFWEQGVDALGLELVNGVAGNVVYDEDALRFWDLAPVLRHREGDAWLVENGRLVASTEE